MLHIPVTFTGNSSVEVTLEGEVFEIYTKYNYRNERVYMDILKDGVQILSGVRLVENILPTFYYAIPERPKGEFVLGRLNLTENKATLGNIGADLDYTLAYVPFDDIGLEF